MRFLALILLAALPLFPETREERGKRIVDEALAALGGEKFLAIDNVVETGRAYSFGNRGLRGLAQAKMYTRFGEKSQNAYPDFLAFDERQSFTKNDKEMYAYLFSGGNGYEITYRGARPMQKPVTERYREAAYHNLFNILRLRLDEPGLTFISQGSDIIDNQPMEKVEIIDAENRSITAYFHRSTKLPFRQVFRRRNPDTRLPVDEVTTFSKYRAVENGALWPFAVQRMRDGDKLFEMYSESVEINQKLEPTIFELPSGIPMLKPER